MISCDKIKELLLTSYIDGELDEKTKKTVEDHLSGCPECKALLTLLQKDIIEPLEGSALTEPAGEVWTAIEEKISEPVGAGERVSVIEKIWRAALNPVPVAAFSFLIIGVLVFSFYSYKPTIPKNTEIVVENYFSRHIRFFDYLESNGGEYYPDSDHLGFITPIEKYLF